MINVAQGLLIIVVMALTGLLVAIGIQLANILKEVKGSIERVNKILDDAGIISGSVAQPIADVSSFFKIISLLVDFIKDKGKKTKNLSEEKEEKVKLENREPENKDKNKEETQPEKPKNKSRHHFFLRRGKKIN